MNDNEYKIIVMMDVLCFDSKEFSCFVPPVSLCFPCVSLAPPHDEHFKNEYNGKLRTDIFGR